MAALWCAGLAGARPAFAQRPPGADTLSERAIADSLDVLGQLKLQIKQHPRDASLWFRQGMVAWALYDRDHLNPTSTLDWTRLGRVADSSLRIARSLEPNNPRYILTTGQYFLGTGIITLRAQSYGLFGTALTMARAADDPAVHAEAALEVGRVYWRKYDVVANAAIESMDPSEVRMLANALAKDTADHTKGIDPERPTKGRPYTRRTVERARETLDRHWQPPEAGFAGEADYLQADRYLREAYETLPTFPRAYQQLAMLLAERSRWTELAALAEDRLALMPRDGWTWMTLGLAVYRAGNTKNARAAFDSALRFLGAAERTRLDRIERVLRPRDTVDAERLAPDEFAALQRRYWANADPLWSRPEIDPRSEFLARIAYAELRWTVDELSKRGADSDRGNIYIRYGPPDRIASVPGRSTWSYEYAGLNFSFTSAPTYATAYFANYGAAYATMDSMPAIWDNMHSMVIDTLPVQLARFRATADSVDVLLAARAPIDAIRKASDVTAPARSDFWLLRDEVVPLERDSLMTASGDVRSLVRRLAFGTYGYRFEASADGSVVAGRATGTIDAPGRDPATALPVTGFGASDLVLATSAHALRPAPLRWSDYEIVPAAGPVPRGSEISLLWENYDFGASDDHLTKYGVSVTITAERPLPERITARIVGSINGLVGRSDYVDGVRFRFDRTQTAAPIVVDLVTIALDKSPPGTYVVTLELTDQVTGKSTERSRRIVLK